MGVCLFLVGLSSIAARRAAKKIVCACRYGVPQLVIIWQARLAVLGAALFQTSRRRSSRWSIALCPAEHVAPTRPSRDGSAGRIFRPPLLRR